MSNSEYLPKEHQPKEYSADDVHRILTLAMEQDEQRTGTFSKAALSEMGLELGLENSALSSAIEVWEQEKIQYAKKAVGTDKKRQKRQMFYRYELVPYLAVNTFLIILNFSLSGAITWAIYPLLGWGLGLLLGISPISSKSNRRRIGLWGCEPQGQPTPRQLAKDWENREKP